VVFDGGFPEEVGAKFLFPGGRLEAAVDFLFVGGGVCAVGFARLVVLGGADAEREEAEQPGETTRALVRMAGASCARALSGSAGFVPIAQAESDEQVFDCPGVKEAQGDFFELVGRQSGKAPPGAHRNGAEAPFDLWKQDIHLAFDAALLQALGDSLTDRRPKNLVVHNVFHNRHRSRLLFDFVTEPAQSGQY
jgi:hypothetical protein